MRLIDQQPNRQPTVASRSNLLQHFAAMCLVLFLCVTLGGSEPPVNSTIEYDLSWHTIDGGGGISSAGAFALSGTIGQPDAGLMSGGSFAIAGGFWAGASGITGPPPCPADLTGDGKVDGADLGQLLAQWGNCEDCQNCPADLTGDCKVDGADLGQLLAQWGPCPE